MSQLTHTLRAIASVAAQTAGDVILDSRETADMCRQAADELERMPQERDELKDRLIAKLTNGRICRWGEHIAGLCDCREMRRVVEEVFDRPTEPGK